MWASFGLGALSITLIALTGFFPAKQRNGQGRPRGPSAAQEVSSPQIQINPHVVIQTDPLDNELYVLANEVGDSDARVQEFDDPKTCGRRQSSNLHGLGGGWLVCGRF